MSFTSPLSPAHSFVPGPPVINIHSVTVLWRRRRGGGVYSYSSDTVEGPRAPAVKQTARQAGGRSHTRRDFPLSVKIHSGIRTRPLPSASKAENWPCELFLAARPLRQLLAVTVGGGIAALSVSYDSCRRPEEPRRYRRVPRCIARRRARVVPSPRHVGAAPRRDKFGGLRDMSSTLAQ